MLNAGRCRIANFCTCNCRFSQLWPINEVWNKIISSATAAVFHDFVQRGSRFCLLTLVRTFLPTLSFKLHYIDLDFIEHGSQVRGLSAVFTESMQLYAQKGNFEFCSSSFETDSLNAFHPLDSSGACISQCSDLYLPLHTTVMCWLKFKTIKVVHSVIFTNRNCKNSSRRFLHRNLFETRIAFKLKGHLVATLESIKCTLNISERNTKGCVWPVRVMLCHCCRQYGRLHGINGSGVRVGVTLPVRGADLKKTNKQST